MTFQIGFGLLTKKIEVDVPGVRVLPRPDFNTIAAQFQNDLNRDGYFYPRPSIKSPSRIG
jgi:hypothetical protein